MFARLSLILATFVATAVAFAQDPALLPNVIVPKSTAVQPGEKPGTPHTHYLIYKGPWNHRSIDSYDPVAMIGGPALSGPDGYHPSDIHAAYNYPNNRGGGAIAIVLWFSQPNILADFNTFSAEFGLPQETSTNATASTNKVFQVVYAQGTQPIADADSGGEESLDTQWTHAMAPNAKIYLVEAASNDNDDLVAAERLAATLPGVTEVSNSWGEGESSGELALDSNFYAKNVLFLASAGDFGGVQEWPSESPNVIGVGGTSLDMNNGVVTSETAWNGSGGGPSSFEPRPSFQNSIISLVGGVRGAPDIAAVADPATGVAIYDSYEIGGWTVVGGTSVACPVCAGMLNGRQYVEADSATYLKRVYALNPAPTYFRDITSGSAGSFTATAGWDFITGYGCPLGLLPPPIQNIGFNATTAVAYPNTTQKALGTATSLNLIDGNQFVVNSVFQTNLGQVAGMGATYRATFTGTVAGQTVASAYFTLSGTAPAGSTTGYWLFNWKTATYDYQGSVALGSSISTHTINIPLTYFDANNNIRIIVRADVPQRYGVYPAAFKLSIDQLQLAATPNQNF